MKWTPEQNKVIKSRHKNLLVSASAGSGKTSVMIQRILSLISEGADLGRMLISTFTKSSAADMREKLYTSLSAESGDPHIAHQLEILPQADITNLHSWYQRIIKKYFYALGMDPAFEILEENEAALVLSSALDEVIDDNLSEGDECFLKLYEYLRTYRGDSVLRSYIISIYNFAMTREDPLRWLDGAAENDVAVWQRMIDDDYAFRRQELIRRIDELEITCMQAKFTRNLKTISEIKNYLAFEIDSISSLHGKVPPEFVDLNEAYKALKQEAVDLRQIPDSVKNIPAYCTLDFKSKLTELTKQLKKRYEEEKESRSLMDFNDLEHICARLISDSEVKDEIINSYDYVFVDEYQDINPLQESILNRLSSHSLMFYVGDIKQSIYAFRGCEPSIFQRRYERYKRGDGGEAIELNVNFRSGSVITDFCNKIMSRVMTSDFGGVDYRNEAMLKSVREGEGDVSITILPTEKESKVVSDHYDIEEDVVSPGRDAEADAAADYILELASKGVNFGDIAVLVRGNSSHLENLKFSLSERGIPCKYSDNRKFCDRREIMPLISFLKLLNNYHDEYNLIAVMRSVFGGFSESELAEIALSPADGFYNKTHNYDLPIIGEKCKAFWNKIDEYFRYSGYHTVFETINKIVGEYDYFKYIFAEEDREAADALNAFLEHLSSCKYAGSIYTYLSYIKNSSPVYEAPEENDSVNIMTIHKSKGLEFSHVIYFNCEQKFSVVDYNSPMILDERGIHLKNWDEENRIMTETLDRLAAKGELFMRRKEEELRLIYVALTRAKNSLAIFGCADESIFDDTPYKRKAIFDSDSALDIIAPSAFAERRKIDFDVQAKNEKRTLLLQKRENPLAEELRRRFSFVSSEDRHEQKSYVTKLASLSRPLEFEKSFTAESRGNEEALLKGTTYHLFMEKLRFGEDFLSQWLSFPEEERNLVDFDSVKFAFEEMSRLCRGKKYYKEAPFTYNAPSELIGGKSGNLLVQGVVDLMIEDPDGFILIDYKITRPENIINEVYKTQLFLYAQAIEKILNKPVKEKYLYSFVMRKLISM